MAVHMIASLILGFLSDNPSAYTYVEFRPAAGHEQSAYLRDPQWAALARCAEGLRSAQDDLQPFHPLEPSGGFQPNICRTGERNRLSLL